MALPHCPRCNATSTQANVNTLNCLACGCVFDFAGEVVALPEQGITTTEDHAPAVPEPEPVAAAGKRKK